MTSRSSALWQAKMNSLLVDGGVAIEMTGLRFKTHETSVSKMSFFDGQYQNLLLCSLESAVGTTFGDM